MLVRKTLQLSEVELKMEGESGKFAGYASVFDGVDSYGDTIVKGAFAETLKSNGMPKMFYNHDWSGLPIGKFLSVQEDSKGLFVEGELTKGVSLSEDVAAAMRHGTIDGLSIGGYLKKGDYEETEKGRTITKWSKLMEISPVVFPADFNARIHSIKSISQENINGAIKWLEKAISLHEGHMDGSEPVTEKSQMEMMRQMKRAYAYLVGEDDSMDGMKSESIILIEKIKTIREFETFLRDASGFSKGATLALVARAKSVFSQWDAGENNEKANALLLSERVNSLASRLNIK